MADIFISYKREDQEELGRVRPVAEALTAEGYDVFYDVHVPPGSSWEDVLQSKINAARAVIVLWSRHSVDSDWVKEEAEMAKHAGKLIPVFLDPVAPPFGFARIEGANLANWNGDLQNIEWQNLVAAVKAKIGSGERAPTPNVTRVAYRPSKSLTVSKSQGSGGGLVRSLLMVAALVVIGAGAFMGWDAYQSAQFEQDRRMDEAVDEVMDREIDRRDWERAAADDTIEAYQRYLTVRTDGAYRDEAADRIAELREEAAASNAPTPAPPARRGGNFVIDRVALGGSEVVAGNDIRVNLTIRNAGDMTLSNEGVFTDFVLSRDTTAPIRATAFSSTWSEDALLRGGRSSTLVTLVPDQTHNWTEVVEVPSGWPAGRFNVCVVVDSAARAPESNETDNVACAPITVTSPAPSAPASGPIGEAFSVKGIEFKVTGFSPSTPQLNVASQRLTVSFDYANRSGRALQLKVQPGYSGPGTCRWSGSGVPAELTANQSGSATANFGFTGDCDEKTLENIRFWSASVGTTSDNAFHDIPISKPMN